MALVGILAVSVVLVLTMAAWGWSQWAVFVCDTEAQCPVHLLLYERVNAVIVLWTSAMATPLLVIAFGFVLRAHILSKRNATVDRKEIFSIPLPEDVMNEPHSGLTNLTTEKNVTKDTKIPGEQ